MNKLIQTVKKLNTMIQIALYIYLGFFFAMLYLPLIISLFEVLVFIIPVLTNVVVLTLGIVLFMPDDWYTTPGNSNNMLILDHLGENTGENVYNLNKYKKEFKLYSSSKLPSGLGNTPTSAASAYES